MAERVASLYAEMGYRDAGLERGLSGAKSQLENTGRAAQQGGTRFTELASQVNIAKQALGVLQGVAQETWQAIGEGAQLELSAQRFDKLAASIGSTSDAILTDFKAATGGMTSNAAMIENASRIISLGLATNQTDVVRLGNVVSQLGLDMGQVILTFANDSKLRLDSLGLSITDVEKRTDAYKASGVEASKAFDMAVLDALEGRLELIGSAAGTTAGSMMQLDASWQNLTDTGKQWLALRWSGPITGLSNTLTAVEESSNKGHSSLRNFAVVINELNNSLGGRFIPTGNVLIEKFFGAETAAIEAANAALVFDRNLTRLAQTTTTIIHGFSDMGDATEMYGQAAAQTNRGNEAGLRTLKDYENTIRIYANSLDRAGSMQDMYADAAQRAAAASIHATNIALQQSEATDAQTASQAAFFSSLIGNEETLSEYEKLMGAVITTSVQVAGRTEEQSEELERLQGIYERTLEDISDYRLGIDGVGLSEERRAEKVAELELKLRNLEAAMGPLVSIQDQYAIVTSGGTVNTEMLNSKIFEQIEAMGLSAEQAALAGVALGQFTQEEADAMLKSVLLQSKIEELSGSWNGTAADLARVRSELSYYIEQLNAVPSDVNTNVNTNYTSSGTPPDSYFPEQTDAPDAMNAAGGSFTVPPGYDERQGRPFVQWLSSGERVEVTPAGGNGATHANRSYTWNVYTNEFNAAREMRAAEAMYGGI